MICYIVKSKKICKSNHSRGLALLSLLIVFSIFCLGLIYIIQTNSLVGSSYKIRRQKAQLKELESKNQELKMNIARWQSPAHLEEAMELLGMVGVDEITYLEEKAMAVKNEL